MRSQIVGCALLLLGGCSNDEGATLLVDLRTDFVAGVEFASVRTSAEDPIRIDERAAVRGEDFTDGLRVAELSDLPAGNRLILLRLLDIDGAEVAVRRARIIVDRDMGITLSVTRSCAGISCADAETCSGGRCVNQACIEGASNDACNPPECMSSADCAAMSECAEPRCETGLCLYREAAGACEEGEYCDVASGCRNVSPPTDSGVADSALADSGVADAGDTGAPDAGSVFACGAPPDGDTVALYRMEEIFGGQFTDTTGLHDGSFPEEMPDTLPSRAGCGSDYAGRPNAYALVPDSPAFDLAEGALDFLFKPAATGGNAQGLLSRDAQGSAFPGHITIYYERSGRVVVRFQDRLTETHRCSEPGLAAAQWHHVGVNFGPGGLALYVDGVEQRGTGTWFRDTGQPAEPCELDDVTYGIAGNDNAWAVGASSDNATEGSGDLITNSFLGELDEVRISRVRRDFAGLAPFVP